MKVTDDPFYEGLFPHKSFHTPTVEYGAFLIVHGLGTDNEEQDYSPAEKRWACWVLDLVFKRTKVDYKNMSPEQLKRRNEEHRKRLQDERKRKSR